MNTRNYLYWLCWSRWETPLFTLQRLNILIIQYKHILKRAQKCWKPCRWSSQVLYVVVTLESDLSSSSKGWETDEKCSHLISKESIPTLLAIWCSNNGLVLLIQGKETLLSGFQASKVLLVLHFCLCLVLMGFILGLCQINDPRNYDVKTSNR